MYHGLDDDRHVLLVGTDVRHVGAVPSQVTATVVMSQVLPADVHELRVMSCSKAKHAKINTGVCQGLNAA